MESVITTKIGWNNTVEVYLDGRTAGSFTYGGSNPISVTISGRSVIVSGTGGTFQLVISENVISEINQLP